jgi:hypothetical protein
VREAAQRVGALTYRVDLADDARGRDQHRDSVRTGGDAATARRLGVDLARLHSRLDRILSIVVPKPPILTEPVVELYCGRWITLPGHALVLLRAPDMGDPLGLRGGSIFVSDHGYPQSQLGMRVHRAGSQREQAS